MLIRNSFQKKAVATTSTFVSQTLQLFTRRNWEGDRSRPEFQLIIKTADNGRRELTQSYMLLLLIYNNEFVQYLLLFIIIPYILS